MAILFPPLKPLGILGHQTDLPSAEKPRNACGAGMVSAAKVTLSVWTTVLTMIVFRLMISGDDAFVVSHYYCVFAHRQNVIGVERDFPTTAGASTTSTWEQQGLWYAL